jgi:acetyl-CoA acetyltransferase
MLASERFVRERGLGDRAVEIVGMALKTDRLSTFEGSDMSLAGFDMTRAAATSVYEQSGIGPDAIDVVELHDCFSANELITYEGLGLCEAGKAGELIDSGAVTYGGEVVVNPSGGLISKGHPLGATGLAQCSEITWQLRGEAGERQVAGARIGLQHNLGLGGAVVVGMYRK